MTVPRANRRRVNNPSTNESKPQQRRRLGTAKDVATYLSVPLSTVYDWARFGTMPGIVRLGRRVRFDLDAVETWVDEGGDVNAAIPNSERQK